MPDETPQRSYGCSYGCGNPYDYVFVSVADGTTEFLCLPCFVQLAQTLLKALIDPTDGIVQQAVADMGQLDTAPVRNNGVRPRGKNAPVNAEDDDLIAAFDGIITADDLPDEFR